MQNNKLKLPKDDARAKVEGFALQVFDGADTEDRAGNATMQTALAFKTCVELMDVCQQFGELASDVRCCCVVVRCLNVVCRLRRSGSTLRGRRWTYSRR